MALLEVRDIDVFYGDVQVVFGLELRVEEGEVVSIIGGNGAGKSTLLKTISGLMQPAKGEIAFEGKAIHNRPPEEVVERGIVQVPEGRRLFSLMSVQDNLIVGAYNKRADGQRQQTLEMVYQLFPRLRERLAQMAMTLSGGEQQMVAIGRALMARPKLLCMDEPSMGLSPALVEQVFEIIQAINKQGTTIFVVEQNANMALSIAHRGYVLQTGEVVLSGTARSLLENEMVQKAYLGRMEQSRAAIRAQSGATRGSRR